MKFNKNIDNEFYDNLNYIITNLEKDIILAKHLKDEKYFLLTKIEIINSLNQVYEIFKTWRELY